MSDWSRMERTLRQIANWPEQGGEAEAVVAAIRATAIDGLRRPAGDDLPIGETRYGVPDDEPPQAA